MEKQSFFKYFTFKNNSLFLVILILLLGAGFIYQYGQTKELKNELEKKSETPSGSIFGQVEPLDWEDPENPQASLSLTEEEIPKGSIDLEMSTGKIVPEEFEVKSGKQITFAVTALDKVHVLKFKEEILKDVAVGIAKGETKIITFYAPAEPGEYHIYCDVPGHGETSLMKVVK